LRIDDQAHPARGDDPPDRRFGDGPGARRGAPRRVCDAETLARQEANLATPSETVRAAVGVPGVAEAAALAACGEAPASGAAPAEDPLPVEVLRVHLEDGYADERAYPGTVRSRRTSPLGFERGGEVVTLHVDEGDALAPGDPIAALDTARLRA